MYLNNNNYGDKVLKTFISQVDMKDIQAATMAIPTSSSSSKDSAFKVSIDVKDLEKVEKIHLFIAGDY